MIKSFLRLAFVAVGLLFVSTAANAANKYAVCTVTCTWNNVTGGMWATTSGGSVTGVAPPSTADTAIFDGNTCVGGVTCTITTSAPPSIGAMNFSACTASTTGCILDMSVNNDTITNTGQLTNSGSGTRQIKCGTGTLKFTGVAGLLFSETGSTGFTNTCSGGTVLFQPSTTVTSQITFTPLPSDSFGTLSVVYPAPTYPFIIAATTGLTLGTLSISGANVEATANITYSITNALSWAGTSSAPIFIAPTSTNNSPNQVTFNVAADASSQTSTFNWVALLGVKFTNAITTAPNSFSLGYNTNFTPQAPTGGSGGRGIIGG